VAGRHGETQRAQKEGPLFCATGIVIVIVISKYACAYGSMNLVCSFLETALIPYYSVIIKTQEYKKEEQA